MSGDKHPLSGIIACHIIDNIPIIAYFFAIPVVGSACLERAGCAGSQERGERAWNNIQRQHQLRQGMLNPVMR